MIPSALFLDRDGTLVPMVLGPDGTQDSPYFASQMELFPGLGKLLAPWIQARVPVFVVTNQPGIAKGHFTVRDLDKAHSHLLELMANEGIPVRDIASCIHHPAGKVGGDPILIRSCECRKPKPGMILQLAAKYGIDLSKAVYIGDSEVDEKAAKAAGVGTFAPVKTWISDNVPVEKRKLGFPDAPRLDEVLGDLV